MLTPGELHLIFQVLVNHLHFKFTQFFAKDSFRNPFSFHTQSRMFKRTLGGRKERTLSAPLQFSMSQSMDILARLMITFKVVLSFLRD